VSLAVAVAEARAALLAADQPVDGLDAAWGAPWRVALLGAEGVGKTTLANRLSARAAPTGLGGVTRAHDEIALPGVLLVDLPAIGADGWRADLAADADAAIWLVDGLQPLPASEVEAVALGGAPAVLHVRVTRLDLVDPGEVPSVLERARSRLAAFRPRSVDRLDPRRDPPPLALLVRDGSGRARRRALADAMRAATLALPAPDRSPIAAWRALARRAAARLAHEPADRAAQWAQREWAGAVLPSPPVDDSPRFERILGGDAHARRARLLAFGRWAAEAELVVRDALAVREAPIRAAAAALARLGETIAVEVHREEERSG
jgi:hypothetical protein